VLYFFEVLLKYIKTKKEGVVMFIGPANDEIKKMGGSNVVVLE
jgi:hypothetical protein